MGQTHRNTMRSSVDLRKSVKDKPDGQMYHICYGDKAEPAGDKRLRESGQA